MYDHLPRVLGLLQAPLPSAAQPLLLRLDSHMSLGSFFGRPFVTSVTLLSRLLVTKVLGKIDPEGINNAGFPMSRTFVTFVTDIRGSIEGCLSSMDIYSIVNLEACDRCDKSDRSTYFAKKPRLRHRERGFWRTLLSHESVTKV